MGNWFPAVGLVQIQFNHIHIMWYLTFIHLRMLQWGQLVLQWNMAAIIEQGYNTAGFKVLSKDGLELDDEYLKRYKCVICNYLLRGASQLVCGDRICKACFPSKWAKPNFLYKIHVTYSPENGPPSLFDVQCIFILLISPLPLRYKIALEICKDQQGGCWSQSGWCAFLHLSAIFCYISWPKHRNKLERFVDGGNGPGNQPWLWLQIVGCLMAALDFSFGDSWEKNP